MSSTPPIEGYRPLTEAVVETANQNKLIEELVLRLVDEHVRNPNSLEIDQRWVSIARSHFQEGFMALNRSLFRPQRITGAIDTEEIITRLTYV